MKLVVLFSWNLVSIKCIMVYVGILDKFMMWEEVVFVFIVFVFVFVCIYKIFKLYVVFF